MLKLELELELELGCEFVTRVGFGVFGEAAGDGEGAGEGVRAEALGEEV